MNKEEAEALNNNDQTKDASTSAQSPKKDNDSKKEDNHPNQTPKKNQLLTVQGISFLL